MNKLLGIVILSMVAAGDVVCQQLFVETYFEQTPTSPKMGVAMGYTCGVNYQVGGFYQNYEPALSSSDVRNPLVEREFFGLFASVIVKEWDSFSLSLKARTGIANREHFVISPGFQVDYEPIRRLHLLGGVAFRTLTPSALVGIRFDLSGQRRQKVGGRTDLFFAR